MKLFDELKKYCDNHGIILQIDVFRKDKNRYELTLDNFFTEELKDIRDIIRDYAKIENDVYLAGNGRAIDIYFKTLDESKKYARKSIKESRKKGYIRKTEYEIDNKNYSISDNAKLFNIIDDLDSKGFAFKYESEWISKDICKHFLAEDDEVKVDLYK